MNLLARVARPLVSGAATVAAGGLAILGGSNAYAESAASPPKLIVFAGGGRAGKTTTLEMMKANGYKVLPESAFRILSTIASVLPNGNKDLAEWRKEHSLAMFDLIIMLGDAAEREAFAVASAPLEGYTFVDRCAFFVGAVRMRTRQAACDCARCLLPVNHSIAWAGR